MGLYEGLIIVGLGTATLTAVVRHEARRLEQINSLALQLYKQDIQAEFEALKADIAEQLKAYFTKKYRFVSMTAALKSASSAPLSRALQQRVAKTIAVGAGFVKDMCSCISICDGCISACH